MMIRYPLQEDEFKRFHDRLDEVLRAKSGCQVIILMDDSRLTNYYQNICVPELIMRVRDSSEEYARLYPSLMLNHE